MEVNPPRVSRIGKSKRRYEKDVGCKGPIKGVIGTHIAVMLFIPFCPTSSIKIMTMLDALDLTIAYIYHRMNLHHKLKSVCQLMHQMFHL